MILWHNPRCSKSREALKLLQEAGQDPDIRLYLKEPPLKQELATLRDQLGLPVIAMMRTKEKTFKDLGLADADDDALLEAMAAHPVLLERPVLVVGDRAVIGRPPENVLDLV